MWKTHTPRTAAFRHFRPERRRLRASLGGTVAAQRRMRPTLPHSPVSRILHVETLEKLVRQFGYRVGVVRTAE